METAWQLLLEIGIPSACVAFCSWFLQRKIERKHDEDKEIREKRQAEQDHREKMRMEYEKYMYKAMSAVMSLSEATAKAVQRIPDAKCNGDMHEALNYEQRVKHEQRDFMVDQAMEGIKDDD